MKIIFLDIDGVLNCDDTPNPRKFPYVVDSQLLELFRELVRATGTRVVLSSTWRVDPVGLFAAKFYDVLFEDICPDMPGAPRCEGLQAWLRKHPEVMRYVVLDDDDDCLNEHPLFQPSSKTRLTPGIAKGIEDHLAGRSDKDMRANALKRLGQIKKAVFPFGHISMMDLRGQPRPMDVGDPNRFAASRSSGAGHGTFRLGGSFLHVLGMICMLRIGQTAFFRSPSDYLSRSRRYLTEDLIVLLRSGR
jgi:HAD domain in Swiss Army Knife RNA repair proteins